MLFRTSQLFQKVTHIKGSDGAWWPVALIDPNFADIQVWDATFRHDIKSPAADWDWGRFLFIHRRLLARLPRIRSMLFAVVVNTPTHQQYPIGFVWALSPLLSTNPDLSVSAKPILAYLCRASRASLETVELPDLRVGGVLQEAVVQFSKLHGFGGRFMLHADPQGGQPLMDAYLSRGMSAIPKDAPLSSPLSYFWTKANDGRYLQMTPESLPGLYASLDARFEVVLPSNHE